MRQQVDILAFMGFLLVIFGRDLSLQRGIGGCKNAFCSTITSSPKSRPVCPWAYPVTKKTHRDRRIIIVGVAWFAMILQDSVLASRRSVNRERTRSGPFSSRE